MKLIRSSAFLLSCTLCAALAACGSGGSSTSPASLPSTGPSSSPTATPTPTSSPSGSTITSDGKYAQVYDGSSSPLVFGTDNWQTNGASTADTDDGDVAGGFNTPANSSTSIDTVPCTLNSETAVSGKYHVHSFLGLYVNGVQYAIPDGIGMQSPSGEPITAFANACYLHTHAPSGLIHVEDPTQSENYAVTFPQYNLQTLLDIWGYGSLANLVASVSPGFSGSVSVYAGTPCANNAVGCSNPQTNPNGDGNEVVTSYTLQTGAANSVLFGHHVAIWIIAGKTPSLPSIEFAIAN
jgi:hypothetical protein